MTNDWKKYLGCLAVAVAGCAGGAEGEEAAKQLTADVILPNEGSPLVDPETDNSITTTNPNANRPTIASPGQMVTVSIPYNAPNGNIVGAGMRFGGSGPIRTIQIPNAMGTTDGTLRFQFQIPDEVCKNLKNICHGVKCEEFVVTAAGKVSKANIADLVMQCNGCGEESCEELVPECYEQYCSSATACPNGAQIKSCVKINLGDIMGKCWYVVGAQKFECPCTSIQSCATMAVNACQ